MAARSRRWALSELSAYPEEEAMLLLVGEVSKTEVQYEDLLLWTDRGMYGCCYASGRWAGSEKTAIY